MTTSQKQATRLAAHLRQIAADIEIQHAAGKIDWSAIIELAKQILPLILDLLSSYSDDEE